MDIDNKSFAIYSAMTDIDDKFISLSPRRNINKVTVHFSNKRAVFISLVAITVLAISISVFAVIGATKTTVNKNNGTLYGADQIYPTVLVNGEYYCWKKGVAIVASDVAETDTLLSKLDYYGEIINTQNKIPESDRELVSLFKAEGKIYTNSHNADIVYILLTTDWMSNTMVIFERMD